MLVRNIQAVWASPAMAVPERDTFRLVSDCQAVNSQVEQTPKVKTDLLRGLDCKVWVKVPSVPVCSVSDKGGINSSKMGSITPTPTVEKRVASTLAVVSKVAPTAVKWAA